MKKKKFAKTLVIRWEDGGNGESWRGVFDSIEDAAEIGETVEVGIYELVERKKVRLVPQVE